MKKYGKIALGIFAVVIVSGLLAVSQALASPDFAGMMGNNSIGGMMDGIGTMGAGIKGMMAGNFDMREMHEIMHGNNSNFDMNKMHETMHGEKPDIDMNAIMKSADFKLFNSKEQESLLKMHQRMLSGNLTQEDINEMKEHAR